MPTWAHGSGFDWFQDWLFEMRVQGYISRGSLSPHPNITLKGSSGRFSGSVALKVRFSETYNQLIADADLLLEGSQGKIRVVILVKLSPLGLNDTHCQAGFVEVHEYNPASGTRQKRGGRKTLYPIPRDHAQQCITLKWDDIVRDNMDLLLLQPTPPPPALMLDELRKCVDGGLKRHLITGAMCQERI
ncbi:hypothetical protein ARAM_003530 [Aspergillus rambellii]|uniref:Uncharacterized protein n=1 Tax=Aspergillus rambellii TaxID=308745 RepID=A0A0F8V2G6_9EURO|nr:hypothetical protein ARAM_003530 [Aspergillus rambellii]